MTDEPYKTLAIEERLAQVERELGLVPTAGNPLAQGLTAKICGRIAPLSEDIVDMGVRMDRLEGRVDYTVATLQKLRRSAFKRK